MELPSPSVALMSFSFRSSKSRIFTRERRIPIWTYKSPLALGSVLTVPLRFMDSTLTPSPIFSFFGEMGWLGPLGFTASFSSVFFSWSLSLARSASSSLPMPELAASLLICFMVWSAVSLASRRMRWASSVAFFRILSLRSSRRSSFWVRRVFKEAISSL